MNNFFSTIFSWAPRSRGRTPGARIVAHLVIGGLGIAIAISATTVIRRAIEQRVETAREKLLLLKAVEERQQLLVTLTSDYKRVAPILPAVYGILPAAEEILVFADALDTLVRETGNRLAFEFDGREPAPDPMSSDVFTVRFRAVVEGSAESFDQLFRRLASFRYMHTVDTLHIESAQGIFGAATMRITGTVFIRKP